jgi:hypothetical protein
VEQILFKGWREYFFGSPKLARKNWNQIGIKNFSIRIVIALLATFLPKNLFLRFKNSNFRLKLLFMWDNLMGKNKKLNKIFTEVINNLQIS